MLGLAVAGGRDRTVPCQARNTTFRRARMAFPSTPWGMAAGLNFKEAPIPYRTRRAQPGEAARSRVNGKKGLTADGSTRQWRRLRDSLPGKPARCPDGGKPFVNHKVSRHAGGKDVLTNLEWRCGKNPGVGRPKGS